MAERLVATNVGAEVDFFRASGTGFYHVALGQYGGTWPAAWVDGVRGGLRHYMLPLRYQILDHNAANTPLMYAWNGTGGVVQLAAVNNAPDVIMVVWLNAGDRFSATTTINRVYYAGTDVQPYYVTGG